MHDSDDRMRRQGAIGRFEPAAIGARIAQVAALAAGLHLCERPDALAGRADQCRTSGARTQDAANQ